MKKNLLIMSLLALGLGMTATSCGDEKESEPESAADLNYSETNSAAWGNYAKNVALLLKEDANSLNNEWQNGFGAAFKAHNAESGFTSAEACVEQIIDGCIDIANEVGTSKIGEPYNLYKSGKNTEALYAVESWYSWHSRDDYKNNILSIANSLLGKRLESTPSEFDYTEYVKGVKAGTVTPSNSIIEKCMMSGNSELTSAAAKAWLDVIAAWNAIDAIQQPFRNNIYTTATETAMQACETLVTDLEALKGKIGDLNEDACQAITNQFVDDVALPTYAELAAKNNALYEAVSALQAAPSNSAFQKACAAWLAARQPWETSEAFLFGPVADLGLDPNMDSWPLDQEGIANLLKSQDWSQFKWSGEYDEEDEAIEAAQSLRGFHTLEYLLFKDGQARTVK